MSDDIPQDVILALAYARADGSCNMMDRQGVIGILRDADVLEGEGHFDADAAIEWLHDDRQRRGGCYMEALEAMGEHVAHQREAART